MLRTLRIGIAVVAVVSTLLACGETTSELPPAEPQPEPAPHVGIDAGTDAGGERSRGLTLLAPVNDTTTYLMDEFGQEVHRWESQTKPGVAVYLLENGNLLRTANLQRAPFAVNGAGGRLEEFDWDGKLVRSNVYMDEAVHAHHDVEVLPNGNVLMIAWEYKSRQDLQDVGRRPDLLPESGALLEQIVEMNPATGEVVWQWRVWDHLIQDADPKADFYGLVAEEPGRIDINVPPIAPGNSWLHFNSVDYNPELDQILISVRTLSEIWIIDHSTTTDEAATAQGGLRGQGGRLLYRWGNPQNYRAGTAEDRVFYFQHDAKWILPGLPALGSLMVFDNGDATLRKGTRVVEMTPPLEPSGSYSRSTKAAYGPAALDWEYWLPEESFAPFMSGAERLQNGNTSITSGPLGHLLEVNAKGEIVWDHHLNVSVFRAERYPLDFPGFIGRDLSPRGELILQ